MGCCIPCWHTCPSFQVKYCSVCFRCLKCLDTKAPLRSSSHYNDRRRFKGRRKTIVQRTLSLELRVARHTYADDSDPEFALGCWSGPLALRYGFTITP